jgi:hypothetical protein
MPSIIADMIDANARRARVLELLRQATIAQIEFWALQTRLESAMLDGQEMEDDASDKVLEFIKGLAAAAPEGHSNEVYDAIVDEHVTELFRDVSPDVKQIEVTIPPKSCTQRYDERPYCGEQVLSDSLKAGMLVRYDMGSTALVELTSPHAGGWHGKQCMGGGTFVSGRLYEATDLDREIWAECSPWRKP